jgi:hypothetical protein
MPRKKQPPVQPTAAVQVAEAPPPVADNPRPASETKWAEPYRPLVTNKAAGFEMGENKLANQMVFNFAKDPGDQVKERLKYYGYFYHVKQKAWTVNMTPVTREIAQRLAAEFAGEQAMSR